jgi:hypothetical protein
MRNLSCARNAAVLVVYLMFSSHVLSAKDVNFMVKEPTFAIKQVKTMGCWATVATMLQSWHDGNLLSIQSVLATAGADYQGLYLSNAGLSSLQKPAFLHALHLTAEPPASYTAEALEAKLRLWGPLWVTTQETDGQQAFIHARLILGITGDGSSNGTTLFIADPADGQKHTESLGAFTSKMEALAKSDYGSAADVRPLIVHF